MNLPVTLAPIPPLTWYKNGPSMTNGLKTDWHERASVTDFSFIPGFTDLSERLSRAGYSFSKDLSSGGFNRYVSTEFAAGQSQDPVTSHSFFASIRFQRKLDSGTLVFHRAARGSSSDSVDSVAKMTTLDSTATASLTWSSSQELATKTTHASLVSLALFIYGLALPIDDQFGSIDIHYRRSPTKRHPTGQDALFSISTSELKAKLPGGASSIETNSAQVN